MKREKEYNSGKACILSLSLAACVININSTKWAVIKLSRVVNDPQRQNWNIKEHKLVCTSTDMQPVHFQHVHVSSMYSLPPPPPPPLSHSNTHTHAAEFWLAEQSEILLLTSVREKKKRRWTQQNMLFLSKLLFFFSNYLAGIHPSKHVFLRMHACTHTSLLKADPRQYFPFNNANKHLYCFVWWMAWFMRKTSHQQYFSCRIPGDSERGWL